MSENDRNSLPKGWVWTTLDEVSIINPRSFVNELIDDQPISFVPMNAVEAGRGWVDTSFHREYGEVKKGYTRFSEGDVLFAKITPCMENGKVAVALGLENGAGCGSTEFHVLRPLSKMPGRFIMYFLLQESFRAAARIHMTGSAGQLRVPAGFLAAAAFPLPPLAEQRRIVAEIEKQFTRLDAAVASLQRARANLKRYRASVLKAACEGRLVPTEAELARREGRDYEPASVLLERILRERRARWEAQPGRRGTYREPQPPDTSNLPLLPQGWAWATVEQVGALGEQSVLTGPFGTHLGKEDFVQDRAGGVPVLTIGCLKETGVVLDNAVFVPEEKALELARYRLKQGDLLFSRMASVGRAGYVDASVEGALFNYHVMRLRLTPSALLPGFFIGYVRGSEQVQVYLRRINHGVTRPGINTDQLLGMPVVIPPLREQRRIVAEVERRLSVIKSSEEVIEANLRRAERLRQSILKLAFEGKLVPQDPNDEPASVLLERIRAERRRVEADGAGRHRRIRR